jgi:hypothetical protein
MGHDLNLNTQAKHRNKYIYVLSLRTQPICLLFCILNVTEIFWLFFFASSSNIIGQQITHLMYVTSLRMKFYPRWKERKLLS